MSDQVRQARQASGLTQFELAVRANVSPATIYCYEAGKRKRGTRAQLISVARALGLADDALLPNRAGG